MFDGLTLREGIFYGGLGLVVLGCFVAIAVVAIRGALAMDRPTERARFVAPGDDIDWDAIDQQATDTIRQQPSIVAGAFGKARH